MVQVQQHKTYYITPTLGKELVMQFTSREKRKLSKRFSPTDLKFIESTVSIAKRKIVEKIIEPSVIVSIVKKFYGVEITKRTRKREYAHARSVASFFLHKYTLLTLETICSYVGLTDHTSIIHHVDKVSSLKDVYPSVDAEVNEIDKEIQNYYNNLYGKIDTDASNSIQTL